MTDYQNTCAAIFYSLLALFGLFGLVVILTTPPPFQGHNYDIAPSWKDDDEKP